MQTNLNQANSTRDFTGTFARLLDRVLRSRKPVSGPEDLTVERIVVIKPCCLGDMLMATPVLRALSQRFPDASLAVATGEWTQPAIETNPRVDQIIRFPESGSLRSAIQLGWLLRSYRFDLGISLDRSPASALALRIAGIPIRCGIDSQGRGVGLTSRVEPTPGQHETELYLSTLEPFDVEHLTEYPEYYVPDEATLKTRSLVPDSGDRPLVIVHPGGAVNPGVEMLEKRWPATSFGELVSLLSQEANATVVLVGTESDRNAVDTTKQFAQVPVIDLCGQLSMPELAAVTRAADLYVGNDSGTTHLASAVGTPVVAIFGPTSPNRYRPLGRKTRVCAPQASWDLQEQGDLRTMTRAQLPDISEVPLPAVLNACLDLLNGSNR
jgi:heptosyltransferase II